MSGVLTVVSTEICPQKAARRSGNYEPSIWNDEFLRSLNSVYTEEKYVQRANNLKEDVKIMLDETNDRLKLYELVDVLQRLGISYHFENKIDKILGRLHERHHEPQNGALYSTALEFRLLRQHSYLVPQGVFSSFIDETGKFKAYLRKDTKGILSLYEASYLCMEDENILDTARNFTTQCLKEYLKSDSTDDENLAVEVRHALELPFHWRVPRLEARWFIEMYEKRQDKNPVLLELAKMDFNMVQAMHQDELKQVSKWYENTCFSKKLSFARDRLVEGFMWSIGHTFEPQFKFSWKILAKLAVLVTTIDDIYDVYGTLDELELFTDAVERDVKILEKLSDDLKTAFHVLFNYVNEMAHDVLNEHGFNIIPDLLKIWAYQWKADLLESKWYYGGYTPTLSEYLDNGMFSVGGPAILLHAYFSQANKIRKEALEGFHKFPNVIRSSCLIVRLVDDLGTSSDELKRGDVPKSIQCYMNDAGVFEEEAREYNIGCLIIEQWKKMNKDLFVDRPVAKSFIKFAMSLGRISQCFYQFGDGYGIPFGKTKRQILALLIDPIILP